MDTVIAGAILADVGKLLEYEKVGGKSVQSSRGKFLRHPFTGVALAMQCGGADSVCHIIAAHAGRGRSGEADDRGPDCPSRGLYEFSTLHESGLMGRSIGLWEIAILDKGGPPH
jgi:hypothetical protein